MHERRQPSRIVESRREREHLNPVALRALHVQALQLVDLKRVVADRHIKLVKDQRHLRGPHGGPDVPLAEERRRVPRLGIVEADLSRPALVGVKHVAEGAAVPDDLSGGILRGAQGRSCYTEPAPLARATVAGRSRECFHELVHHACGAHPEPGQWRAASMCLPTEPMEQPELRGSSKAAGAQCATWDRTRPATGPSTPASARGAVVGRPNLLL
eukprot:scaffold53763_cov66-Phaeocystis_antarctica.AAC.3